MIKFGANILSQTVQRNLGRATLDLSTTSERLASGQRINKASDDAAGLAISASLNVNARIFTQGVRNLNDGLSVVNIAEGAMGELGNIIVRIEELATQSISETYSDTQRQALQKEATALTAEWNRIVESTSFNGQNLLTGASTRTVLQGGKGAEGTLAVQIGAAQYAGGAEGSAGTISRVTVTAAGVEGSADSSYLASSADGRFTVFRSDATNLVSGDSNGTTDIFVRDNVSGVVTRVNTSSTGAQATGGASLQASISANGRYVSFTSAATNLVSGDTNGATDVFVKDLQTSELTRVSTNSQGSETEALVDSSLSTISADGRFVVFRSSSATLVSGDTNAATDFFLKDRQTGSTVRVSTGTGGVQSNASSGFTFAGISADNRYVVFDSSGSNLVAGDTNTARDIFVKDLLTDRTIRVSTSTSGQEGNGVAEAGRISSDGRIVTFASDSSNLVTGDTNAFRDVFYKNLETGETTRVSTTSSGSQSTGGGAYQPRISADGRFVAFHSSAVDLVAGDTNATFDVFVKDTQSGAVTRVNTDAGGTQSAASAYVDDISPDGRFVSFWSSSASLVSGDTNGVADGFIRDLSRVGVQTLAGLVVSNKASAKVTLDLAQRYRAELLDYRSKLGATTSRISTFVNTLQSSTINYKAASSRITDADIAEEAAKSIASGIRQQVAASLLGQANQAPQIGLQLLRNA